MMPKGQAKFLVGYCIFMLLFTQLLQHSQRYQALLEPLQLTKAMSLTGVARSKGWTAWLAWWISSRHCVRPSPVIAELPTVP